ncbi:MAG TPA: hypothetical protein VG166_01710 [Caulobacteraceae bacterium]|jgi:general secretion pathway protein K|nr:hypothetical protein [Caulobacteraceae bacterium]
MTVSQVHPRPAAGDGGWALVAAVAGIAVLAMIAYQVLAADIGGIATARARIEQAELMAAADAGIATAIHGLGAQDRDARWPIDGSHRTFDFAGVALDVTIEDERGKAPLAGLNESQARALFQGAGAEGDQLDNLVAEFIDWQNEQPLAPQAPPPALQVRHGAMRSLGELAALPGMDKEILARAAPAVTVFPELTSGFDPTYASPLAIATVQSLGGQSANGVDGEQTFLRPDEIAAPDDHLFGRTLTVRVVAQARDGARTRRMAIVELTGGKATPFWIRYVE